jgi:hypothetical protein
MTADLLTEPRISLTALAHREGVHVSTVWRWCLRGVHGHRLESISIGQRRYTTEPAYRRWVSLVNGEPIVRSETPRQRERSIERAERRAAELGV